VRPDFGSRENIDGDGAGLNRQTREKTRERVALEGRKSRDGNGFLSFTGF
jgi:hypothetical protein